MLKLICHIISLFPFFLNAQVNIINLSLIDTSLNIAYIGVENTIELTGLKNNHGTVSFYTTNGTMTNVGGNRYVLRPLKPGECVISFTEKNKILAKKVFFSITFRTQDRDSVMLMTQFRKERQNT